MISRTAPSKRNRQAILTLILIIISVGLCGSTILAQAYYDRRDYPELVERIDEDLLQRTNVTRYYYKLAWHHMEEITDISNLMNLPELYSVARVIDLWMPNFRALLNGDGDRAIISSEQVKTLTDALTLYDDRGSPSLRQDIETEMRRLNPPDFIGLTMNEAWTRLHEIWKDDDPTKLPFYNNPDELIPQPQGEILTDDFYGRFWRTFRISDHNIAFAYPMDWTLYAQSERPGENRGMEVCNYDERTFAPDWFLALSIDCYRLNIVVSNDSNASLESAAEKTFCPDTTVVRCYRADVSETQLPSSDWIVFDYVRKDLPVFGRRMAIRRLPGGELINFSTLYQLRDSREYWAIINSLMIGSNSTVTAPKVIPWEPEPRPPSLRSRVELDITPWPTFTPWPTSYPLMEWTPQSTLSDGPYAEYWAEYRDRDDQYGFIYPKDWILRGQPDQYVKDQSMEICNNNAKEYDNNNPLLVCISIQEFQSDPSLSLAEAAHAFINYKNINEMKTIDFTDDSTMTPERVVFHFTIPEDNKSGETYADPVFWFFFKNPAGKIIIFAGWERDITTAEAQAIIHSFVLGADTPIRSPGFFPSQLINITPQ